MEKIRKSIMIPRVLHIIAVLLMSMAVGGCAQAPAVLSEEELLRLLAEAKHLGQFQQQTWPLLEKKMITYCGRAEEVKVMETGSVALMPVEKTHAGEKLPWLLEGKAASPDLARPHKPDEPLCMTGVLASYMERNDVYWGFVQMVSLEKPPAS